MAKKIIPATKKQDTSKINTPKKPASPNTSRQPKKSRVSK